MAGFLEKSSYEVGEFEKLQELFDRAVEGLAKELKGPVEAGLRRESQQDLFIIFRASEKKLQERARSASNVLSQLVVTRLFNQLRRARLKDQPVSLNEQMLPESAKLGKILKDINFSNYGVTRAEVLSAMVRYMDTLRQEFYKSFSPIEFGGHLLVVPAKNSLSAAFTLHASRKNAEEAAQEEKRAFQQAEKPKLS